MRRLELNPEGWPCLLEVCPPGPFVFMDGGQEVCWMTEYKNASGWLIGYLENGEALGPQNRGRMVQPLMTRWVEEPR